MNEVELKVIPIYKNRSYPKKDEFWTFKNKSKTESKLIKEYMFQEMKEKFSHSDCIIVIENDIVIKILEGKSNE